MKEKTTIGFKYLKGNKSLNGKYTYDLSGKWQTVPGNGAYVAVTGGLYSGIGRGDNHVMVECRGPVDTRNHLPDGVTCFREVRVLGVSLDPTRVGLALILSKNGIMELANLRGVNLRGADLRWANLQGATLQGVNLQGANLQGATLKGADLQGVNLEGANLRGVNLRGADLRWANLQGVNLEGADLQGVNLRWAKNVPDWILERLNHEGIYCR